MPTVRRFAEFHVDASTIRELPSGGISVQGQVTHPGIFTYRNADGTPRREYRPDSAVFSAASLASMEDNPITIDHPRGADGAHRKVTPDTWKQDAVGHVARVRREGDHAVADLVVLHADAVAGIRSGVHRELSWGYDVAVDETAGQTPDGQKYDAIQTAMQGNHVALLPKGRARGGAECVLRVDGDEDATLIPTTSAPVPATMPTPDISPELATALARIDALEAAAKAPVDGVRMDALVEERTALVAGAKALGIEPKGLTNTQIKAKIVAAKSPSLAARADSLSAEALDAAYAVVSEVVDPAVIAAQVALAATVAGPPATRADAKDAADSPAGRIEAARKRSLQGNADTYKNPPSVVRYHGNAVSEIRPA